MEENNSSENTTRPTRPFVKHQDECEYYLFTYLRRFKGLIKHKFKLGKNDKLFVLKEKQSKTKQNTHNVLAGVMGEKKKGKNKKKKKVPPW